MQFFYDVFVVTCAVTAIIMVAWTFLIMIAWFVEMFIEHYMEVHYRKMDDFSFTTNRPQYEYHRDQLRKWGGRANRWDIVMDFLTIQ